MSGIMNIHDSVKETLNFIKEPVSEGSGSGTYLRETERSPKVFDNSNKLVVIYSIYSDE